MLPSFAPPYGLAAAIRSLAGNPKGIAVDAVERLHADALQVREAVLLPSARAGIRWGLQACGPAGLRVQCPVFTCTAVWEAIFRAGAEMEGIDTGPESFLMDEAALASGVDGRHALILCEIYGHQYDLRALERRPGKPPELRIVDLAGGLLHQNILSRLTGRDLAVVSFGRGSKSLYCGWGGMAFTQNPELARALRSLRDTETRPASPKQEKERALRLLLVSLLRRPAVFWTKQAMQNLKPRPASAVPVKTAPEMVKPKLHPLGPEFYSPPTPMERRLMVHNLKNLGRHIERRRELAARYDRNLRDAGAVILPPRSEGVLSHYTIRVPGARRNKMVAALEKAGIECGRLFFFSPRMREYHLFVASSRHCRAAYPQTQRISAEVINLPLHPGLSARNVDFISEKVRSVSAASAEWPDISGESEDPSPSGPAQ